MYLTNPQITDNILTNDGYNKILDGIDKKIAALAKQQYLNQAFGMGNPVNIDAYEKLCDYRRIFYSILMGCNCFKDQHIINIISRIQKLIK